MGAMFSAEKQLDDAVQKKSTRASTLPDISAATPKVSLFKFEGMGQELIDACIKQTEEFTNIAATKTGFMLGNAPAPGTPGIVNEGYVIRNATGVRLSLKDGGQPGDYPPPAIIEPGECASFIYAFTYSYEVQVFEGPVATPFGGGWTAPTQEGLMISPFQINPPNGSVGAGVQPKTAAARVQVKAGGPLVASTLTWDYKATSINQYTITQSLD